MVKALLNSINNIPNTTAQLNSAASDNVSKTDFEKLFDKQQSLASNDKRPEDNTKDDDEESSEKAVSPNDTFAGSVAYDIRQLIAFLKSAGDDTSSNTEETEVQDIDGTETLDADEITKKLLNLEEEDDDKKKDDGETEVQSEPEVETQTDDLTNNNIDSFLEDFEVTTEEVQSNSETQTTSKEVSKETEQSLEDIIDEDQLKELKIESIEAETSDSTGEDDIMQNQTPEEQGVKAMLQADADFAEVKTEAKPAQTVQNTTKPTSSSEVTSNKIIEQITKQMEGMYNGSKVNMVLNPESLGKVSIQLINTKEGLSAQFTVATQEARNLIMKGLDGLKDTLMSHGVSVDNVSVKINDAQESEYNADWTEQEGSRGGNKEQGSQKEQRGKEQFEQMMSFIENENGKV
ncbi:probable flagellar hook-length control protein [Acinetobacter sp. CAG:196]|nr:probable flagellar hook-length control protein [Acinetobacter sp. CAG:196]